LAGTVAAIRKTGLAKGMSLIFTGGGALWAFFEGEELPGPAVLDDKQPFP